MATSRAIVRNHIRTHSERSAEDRAAVSVLETFLRSEGRINTSFACDDKWPNIDGTFEFVSNPDISRRPEQNFTVQIKGTHVFTEKDGEVKYSLQSLGFPAYIYDNVTSDPGILFVVLNPDERGKERVFWKYMSPALLNSIDFTKNSTTIIFNADEEIKNTNESIEKYCLRLVGALFVPKGFVHVLDVDVL